MAREFAPGIPPGRVIKSVPRVSPKADNQEWDVSLSMHPAAVRGDHYDLRLVDPKGKAHSWAMAKLPDPGQSTYAAQQATHSKGYALRKKPWKIPPGYGATRPGKMVEPLYVQKAEVIQAGNEKIRFLRHHGQETDEFVLRKVREEGGKPLWALNNATKNRSTREGQKLPNSKPKYKEVGPEHVALSDAGQVMTPKLDGAHVLVDMKGPGAPMRVYSYRPTERKTGVIEHTFKFPGFQKRTSTPSAKNSMIRAELWASKDGKAIPAEEVGGLLNAGVLRSRKMQQEKGVQLRLTGIDVVRHNGRNYSNKTFDEKLRVLRQVTRGSRGAIEMPRVARTEDEKRRMLADIKGGRDLETNEGVVLHKVDGVAPPTKVKFKPQDDVYVREVFNKPKGKARGHAGGFAYSLTPDGPVVGRVGTGFSHTARKDMLENPEKYVGRVAKVKSQGPFRSGALRAPSFDEWHIDKTPPELMKEGAGKAYHYGPRDVDLIAEGLKTPATLGDEAVEKYRGRAAESLGKPPSDLTREDMVSWLEQSRGPGGSRMGSVLHRPIGEHSSPGQQAYAKRHQLYEIDYDRARREGAIEAAHVVEESPRSQRSVRRRELLRELEGAKGFAPTEQRFLFQGTPHGFVTVKGGTLPGGYLKKQGAGELSISRLEGDDARSFMKKYKGIPRYSPESGEIIGLKSGDEVVGGALMKDTVGDYAARAAQEKGLKPKYTLSAFNVDEEYRGKGHGRRLLNTAMKGRGSIVLGTDNQGRETDDAAVHLYEQAGFKPVKKERRSTFWVKEAADNLYHGSPYKLDKLEPRREHGDPQVPDAVFGTPSRSFALAYAGDKWGDRDINQSAWYDKEDNLNEMSLREMRPGALKDVYKGRKGYMYTLPGEGFERPPRHGARWEQINRSTVTPTESEEIEDVMAALGADPVVKMYPYDPKHPQTRRAVRKSVSRLGEMEPELAEQYKKWRLEKAPPEIAKMFEEEMLKKESQADTLKAIKEYKAEALEEITPKRAVQLGVLANPGSRGVGAANMGLKLVRQHLDERYPGMVESQLSKARGSAGRAAGAVKGLWGE